MNGTITYEARLGEDVAEVLEMGAEIAHEYGVTFLCVFNNVEIVIPRPQIPTAADLFEEAREKWDQGLFRRAATGATEIG